MPISRFPVRIGPRATHVVLDPVERSLKLAEQRLKVVQRAHRNPRLIRAAEAVVAELRQAVRES